jgi:methyl-accepting chemotaxis protein
MNRDEITATLQTLADFAQTLALTAEEFSDTASEAAGYAESGDDDVYPGEVQSAAEALIDEARGLLADLSDITSDLDGAKTLPSQDGI